MSRGNSAAADVAVTGRVRESNPAAGRYLGASRWSRGSARPSCSCRAGDGSSGRASGSLRRPPGPDAPLADGRGPNGEQDVRCSPARNGRSDCRSGREAAAMSVDRTAVTVVGRRASAARASRRGGRSSSPVRAAPTAPRARGRDGSRRRAAHRDPAPTRPQRPGHHLDLPARHRPRRDHRDRLRTTQGW